MDSNEQQARQEVVLDLNFVPTWRANRPPSTRTRISIMAKGIRGMTAVTGASIGGVARRPPAAKATATAAARRAATSGAMIGRPRDPVAALHAPIWGRVRRPAPQPPRRPPPLPPRRKYRWIFPSSPSDNVWPFSCAIYRILFAPIR